MTRDYTLVFENDIRAKEAEEKLNKFTSLDKKKLFGVIDNRGDSLFVTLTHSDEIKKTDKFLYDGEIIDIFNDIVFVAIKNGIHDQNGYLFTSMETEKKKRKNTYNGLIQFNKKLL